MTSAENVSNKLIGIVVFVTVFTAFTPIVLVAFTNISSSGIVLATAVATIGGIMLGIFALKSIMKLLKI